MFSFINLELQFYTVKIFGSNF